MLIMDAQTDRTEQCCLCFTTQHITALDLEEDEFINAKRKKIINLASSDLFTGFSCNHPQLHSFSAS